MSQVHEKDRKPSKVQFIDTARELVLHTMHYATKLPKTYRFVLTTKLVELAQEIYVNTRKIQNKFPATERDIAERRTLLTDSLGLLDSLDCFAGMSKDLFGDMRDEKGKPIVTDYGWENWGLLINKERNLLKAVMLSDSKITL